MGWRLSTFSMRVGIRRSSTFYLNKISWFFSVGQLFCMFVGGRH
ncbi:hypothetical protein Zm00014a_019707 [Zea mays]|uniref:Uncharacterized protein n=1 Tax=Zea mays TaxID=4577 RepID=A0A3L6G448_MAIZE|nr:hypothetical protein Zm00014a_019707 [Zea mays]